MQRVRGIGGVFFKGTDPGRLNAWYAENLGVPVAPSGCASFRWREADRGTERCTVWSVFPEDSDYFGGSGQRLMVNYIVDSLDAMLDQLRDAGAMVEEKVEESEYGRFGWATDPEGNRLELWEPPEVMPEE